jgi:hypothetical protein
MNKPFFETLVDALLRLRWTLYSMICDETGLSLEEYEGLETVAFAYSNRDPLSLAPHITVNLIDRGLIEEDIVNGPHSFYRLTAEGSQLLQKADAISVRALSNSMRDLTEAERRILRRIDRPKDMTMQVSFRP